MSDVWALVVHVDMGGVSAHEHVAVSRRAEEIGRQSCDYLYHRKAVLSSVVGAQRAQRL